MRKQALRWCGLGALGGVLVLAGCHKVPADGAPDGSDPATANLAPANGPANESVYEAGAPQYGSTQAAPSPGYAAAPAPERSRAAAPEQQPMPPSPPEDAGYSPDPYADEYANPAGEGTGGYEQAEYVEQPPPPLPEYEQPPCPGDNYLWTPGYWNYATAGYYWVPGVWVAAPFIGALWTPPYWAFDGGRYGFHHGYWGPHIGFYGGIVYGSGYFGHGYEGGYWNHNQFFYNRSVTRINTTYVRNVYEHTVIINNQVNRISYNGGRGGIAARPAPYEVAAAREQHFGALPVQQAHIEQSAADRSQFASVNGGRPAVFAAARPLLVRTAASASAANLRPVTTQGGFERPGRVGSPGVAALPPERGNQAAGRAENGQVRAGAAPAPPLNQARQPVQRSGVEAAQPYPQDRGQRSLATEPGRQPGFTQQKGPERPQPGQQSRQPYVSDAQRGQAERSQPREQSRPQPLEAPQQAPQQARPAQGERSPRVGEADQGRQQAPRAEPQQAPRAEPQQAPRAEPQQAPRAEPQQAPRAEPQQAPRAEPQQAPRAEPQQAPREAPHAAGGQEHGH